MGMRIQNRPHRVAHVKQADSLLPATAAAVEELRKTSSVDIVRITQG